MFQRLGFCNRVHAVVTAFKKGWIALSDIEEQTLGRVVGFSELLPKQTVKQLGQAARVMRPVKHVSRRERSLNTSQLSNDGLNYSRKG